jgi:hypothetical protein
MNLYQITSVMRALMDSISDAPVGTEEAAEHAQALVAFEGVTENLDAKLRAVIAYALELEAGVEARIAIIDRMQKANERDTKKANWLKDYAKGAIDLVALPMPRIYPEFKLTLAKLPQTAEVTDEAALKATGRFYVTPTTPEPRLDKKALNAAMKDGEVIPGVRLSAVTYRLAIK